MAAMIYKLEIDQTGLRETLALVQQIEAAALRAKAALGVAQAQEFPSGMSFFADETPGHILAEQKRTNELLTALLRRADTDGVLTVGLL